MFFMSIWTWIKVLQWLVIFWWHRHYCRHTVVSYLNLCAQWRQNSSRVRLPCHFFSEEQKSEKDREITKLFCLSYQKRTETMCISMVLHFLTVTFFKGHFHWQSQKICFFKFQQFDSLDFSQKILNITSARASPARGTGHFLSVQGKNDATCWKCAPQNVVAQHHGRLKMLDGRGWKYKCCCLKWSLYAKKRKKMFVHCTSTNVHW